MKQLLFMIALEFVAVFGVFISGPIAPLAVYYVFSVLRPQYLWIWILPTFAWSDFPAGASIAGTVGYMARMFPLGGHNDPPFRGLSFTHWAFMAFGGWVTLTYFTAISRYTAWPFLLEYATIFVMSTVSTIVIRRIDQAWKLYLCITLPLLYLAYHVNSLYIFDGRLDIYHVGLGGLDNNGAGLMIAMGVPLALNAWEGIRGIWRWGFVASIPFALHAVLMSYSRGAMVSLLFVVPMLIIRSRRRFQFTLVTILLACTIPYLAGQEIRARFFTIEQYSDDLSAQQRFGSWGAAIAIANDHPILGVGIRNANLVSFAYGADEEGRTIHSQFLQILADEGYVGLGFYIITLLSFFIGGMRTRRALRGRTDEAARLTVCMTNGLEAALLLFCVGGVFLSLEVFELPYLILIMGAQLQMITLYGFATSKAAAVRTRIVAAPVSFPAGNLPRAVR